MNTTHTPAEWAARNAEMLKDAWAEGDHLRTINAELLAALETVVGCMKLQRDVIERGQHAAAWEHPIKAAESVLARARSTA